MDVDEFLEATRDRLPNRARRIGRSAIEAGWKIEVSDVPVDGTIDAMSLSFGAESDDLGISCAFIMAWGKIPETKRWQALGAGNLGHKATCVIARADGTDTVRVWDSISGGKEWVEAPPERWFDVCEAEGFHESTVEERIAARIGDRF